ncbi:nuclear transport factor 2 family protein [bacterium]|nr:MAG: nuclear transport factor 2 family protein [bacterium]
MEQSQIKSKAKEFIDALRTLENGTLDDVGQLAVLFANDATLTNSALDSKDKQMEGQDEILQFWTQYKETLGDAVSNFHHITLSEDAAGLFWTTEGTNPTGDKVHYHGSTLLVFNPEGTIQFFRGYYNTRELTLKGG